MTREQEKPIATRQGRPAYELFTGRTLAKVTGAEWREQKHRRKG